MSRPHPGLGLAVLIAAVCLLASSVGTAGVAGSEPALIQSGLDALPRPVRETMAADDPALAGFRARFGDDWLAERDARTGAVTFLQGEGIPLFAAGDSVDLATSVRRVRQLLVELEELHGLAPAELRLSPGRSRALDGGRVVFVDFERVVRGVPVLGSRVFARINAGNVVQLGFDRIFPIDPRRTESSMTPRQVSAALDGLLGPDSAPTALADAQLLLVPVTSGDGYDVRLVHRLRRTGADGVPWIAMVDAADGAVLELADGRRFGAPGNPNPDSVISGLVTGMVHPRSALDTQVEVPFGWQKVAIGSAEVVTDPADGDSSDGTYFSAEFGDVRFTLEATSLLGGFDVVHNERPSASGMESGASRVDWKWDDPQSTAEERDVYYHLNRARLHAQQHLSNPWLESIVVANVDLPVLTCNGFWNGTSINFFPLGRGCTGASRNADFIIHEWGHGLEDAVDAGLDYASSEAAADITAWLLSRSPHFAAGFLDVAEPIERGSIDDPSALRDASKLVSVDNIRLRCEEDTDCPGLAGYQCHCEGLILSGAAWDLSQLLGERYGEAEVFRLMEAMHFGAIGSWESYLVADRDWLAIDDRDGNLANGSPNGCLITEAFARHGISSVPTTCQDPHVRLDLVGDVLAELVGDTDGVADPGESLELRLTLANSGDQAALGTVASVTAQAPGLTLNRAFTQFPTVPAAGSVESTPPHIQLTVDPTTECGSLIPLEISIFGMTSIVREIDVLVGQPVQTIYAETFESGLGGWLGQEGDATDGHWTAETPTLTAHHGDVIQSDAAAEGFGFLHTGSNPVWSRPDEGDVDGGVALALSPTFDLVGVANPVLQFDYWFVSGAGMQQPDDVLRVEIRDGTTAVEVFRETRSRSGWRFASVPLSGSLSALSDLRIAVAVADDAAADNTVEAAIDHVRILAFDCDTAPSCPFGVSLGVVGATSLCPGHPRRGALPLRGGHQLPQRPGLRRASRPDQRGHRQRHRSRRRVELAARCACRRRRRAALGVAGSWRVERAPRGRQMGPRHDPVHFAACEPAGHRLGRQRRVP